MLLLPTICYEIQAELIYCIHLVAGANLERDFLTRSSVSGIGWHAIEGAICFGYSLGISTLRVTLSSLSTLLIFEEFWWPE